MPANLYIIKAFDFLLYFINFIYFIILYYQYSMNQLTINYKRQKHPSKPQFRGNYILRAEKYGMF